MKFSEIYQFANELDGSFVLVRALIERVEHHHAYVGRVDVYLPVLDPGVSYGHLVWEMDRSSAYDGEFLVASIRVHYDLPRHFKRFVTCKELMQVFEAPDAKANTKSKFLQLLTELETAPVVSSPMLQSESQAEWMAKAVLFPRRLRDFYLRQGASISPERIAEEVRIPVQYIPSLLSEEYDRNLAELGV